MKTKYNEKLVENVLRDFPVDFLDEQLVLLKQQPTIGGFRPDLIFKDAKGIPVIVEVQLNALDRNHLYRSIEYRDLYCEKKGITDARVILFCNSIPSKYERILTTHNVVCKKIRKANFLKKLKDIAPEIKIASPKRKKTFSHNITPNQILAEIRKSTVVNNNLFPTGTYAFWFSWGDVFYTDINLNYPLRALETKIKGFVKFNQWQGRSPHEPKPMIKTEFSQAKVALPFEFVIGGSSIELIEKKSSHIAASDSWLDLIEMECDDSSNDTKMNPNPHEEFIEISFGNHTATNAYLWDSYINDRRRKFGLCNKYNKKSGEVGYDTEKIEDDISFLHEFQIYTGKYPDFKEERLFYKFEIIPGPGVKQRSWYLERRRALLEKGYAIDKLDEAAKEDEKEWVTIRLYGCRNYIIDAMHYFFHHMKIHSSFGRGYLKKCDYCLLWPMEANTIGKGALKISSKYFLHLSAE